MQQSRQGNYLYCIVRATEMPAIGAAGVDGGTENIRLVREGEVAAVVGDTAGETYRLTRSTAMAHQLVIQEVMRYSTVLPFSFGTVANGDDEVRNLLGRYQQEFLDQLGYLANKAEYGLKALWRDKDQPFKEILAERDDIRRLRDAIAHRSPAQSYQERIQVGRMVSEALEAKREAESKRIVSRLEPMAVEARVNAVFMDEMLLNAAFLLATGTEGPFQEELRSLDREYNDRVQFRLTEASPPFNFVRMPINWR